MNSNIVDNEVLSFQILDRLRIDGSILKGNGTGSNCLVEDNLINAFREVKIELRMILVIELCVHLLCYRGGYWWHWNSCVLIIVKRIVIWWAAWFYWFDLSINPSYFCWLIINSIQNRSIHHLLTYLKFNLILLISFKYPFLFYLYSYNW